jgi:hypothetical protein
LSSARVRKQAIRLVDRWPRPGTMKSKSMKSK